MDETAVVDASPFIFLSRANHLDLLHSIYGKILIPRAVAEEILAMGPHDVSAAALTNCHLSEIVPSPPIPASIRRWGLGPGESSVLALVLPNPQMIVIMDDLAGRRCADAKGLKTRGTLGIVLLARKRGLIRSARATMEELIRSGLYLSQPVLDEALRRVGE